MNYNKVKTSLSVLFVVLIFFLYSCAKKDNDNEMSKEESIKKQELVNVDKDNYTESDEDIFKVDYKEFYDELSPNGEWVQVNGEELGIKLEKGTASGEYEMQKDLLSYIFGVNNAYADVDAGMFFVWKPLPALAVSADISDEPVQYTPYYNGQWINTDAGWYFKAPTPAEEIVHHYGRWTYSPSLGWVWIPGRVWAPAWVDWRESVDYIAWSPLPPSVYIVNNVIPPPVIAEDRFIIIEKRYFVEPVVYKYIYVQNENKVKIIEMYRPDGVMIVNNTVVVRGPSLVEVEKITNRRFDEVKIVKVNNKNDIQFSSDRINVYAPGFKKINNKIKVKTTINKPNKFVNFDNVSDKDREATGNKNESVGDKKTETQKDKSNDNDKNFNRGNDNKDKNTNDNVRKKENKVKENYDRGKNNEQDQNKKQKGNDNNWKNDKQKGNKEGDNDMKKSNKNNGTKNPDGNSGNKNKEKGNKK